jgi:hypothetical protein
MVFAGFGPIGGHLRLSRLNTNQLVSYLVTHAPHPQTYIPRDGNLFDIFNDLKPHGCTPEHLDMVTTIYPSHCFTYETKLPKFYRLKVDSYKYTLGQSGLP